MVKCSIYMPKTSQNVIRLCDEVRQKPTKTSCYYIRICEFEGLVNKEIIARRLEWKSGRKIKPVKITIFGK